MQSDKQSNKAFAPANDCRLNIPEARHGSPQAAGFRPNQLFVVSGAGLWKGSPLSLFNYRQLPHSRKSRDNPGSQYTVTGNNWSAENTRENDL